MKIAFYTFPAAIFLIFCTSKMVLSQQAAVLPTLLPITYTTCEQASCNTELVDEFHLDQPIWSSGTSYSESVLPISGGHSLWQSPSRIERVELPVKGKVFTAGVDYRMTQHGIEFLPGGSVPIQTDAWLHTIHADNPSYSISDSIKPGVRLRISPDFDAYQVRVTYTTESRIHAPKFNKLPRLSRLLHTGKPVHISFYGDSISTGANATGIYSAPHQPGFVDLTVASLSKEFPGQISRRNFSVTGWGIDAASSHVADYFSGQDDLVVVEFGVNDASGGRDKAAFKSDLTTLIAGLRKLNPATELVLIANCLSNPEWAKANGQLQREYRDAMMEVQEADTGVSVLDLTGVWDSMLARKSYWDLTANGINHPNDFGHALYAQALTAGLSK